MTIEIKSIDDLTAEAVENKRTELVAFIQEKYPEIDLSRGVFSTLILELTAIFGAKFEEELARWKASRSMLAISKDPTLADEDAVDQVLSNYNVNRKAGAYATGKVSLLFSKDISYIIPSGYSFTCNGITFITEQSYLIYNTYSEILDSDSLRLRELKTGGYSCDIEVIATSPGSNGCLRKNTELQVVTPMTSLVKAYAAEDFVGGLDVETNTALLTRFKSGLATPAWGNKYNIESLIRSETNHILDMAIVGCNDIEMTRDQLTLFPISVGGKSDIYIKTAPYSTTKTVELDATLNYIEGDDYIWTVIIPETVLPGFWSVTNFDAVDEALMGELISEVNIPMGDINQEDCFFTVYQSRLVTFKTEKPQNPIELYSGYKFNITLQGCPYIDEITNIVTSDNLKPIDSDVVVHAPIPCEVYVTVHLNYKSSFEITLEQQLKIRQNLAEFINNIGFNQTLLVSELVPLVTQELTGSQRVSGIQLDGIILTPTLKKKRVSSNQYIKTPDLPSEGITSKITTYYTRVENISFAFNTEV